MIVFLTDTDGDDIAIDTDAIYAVSVGDLRSSGEKRVTSGETEPLSALHSPLSTRVTLVHTLGGPLVVSQSWEAVVEAWQSGLTLRGELVRDVTAPRGVTLMDEDDDAS